MRLMPCARQMCATAFASVLAALALAATATSAVAADPTTTRLQSSVPSPVWGQSVTFTATVTDNPNPGTTPTGAVQFKVDTLDVGGPVPLDAGGRATYTTSSLSIRTHDVVAVFTSASFDGSADTLAVRVDKADANVVETLSPDPTVAGQSATFLAAVTAAAPGAGAPTGFVQFFDDDGSPIGGAVELDSAGKALIEATAGAGSYRVHAVYFGNDFFEPSVGSVDQTVNKADTAVTLTAPATVLSPRQSVQLTALVKAVPPGDVTSFFGTLQFTLDGVPVGAPVPLNGAIGYRVTFTAPGVPATSRVGAVYNGDDNTNPSSSTLELTVPGAGGPGTSAQQLRAMSSSLIKALRTRGLAALSGVAEPFTASGPGVLEQKVYSPNAPKSAASSKKKAPIVLAAGRLPFAKAGAGVLKLRLTAAGRRAVRRGKALRVAIVTRFTPTNGKAISIVQRLSVKGGKRRKTAGARAGWSMRPIQPAHRAPRLGRAHGRA
jgi:hypothetical protein